MLKSRDCGLRTNPKFGWECSEPHDRSRIAMGADHWLMEISCVLSEGGLYCVPKYMALVRKEHLQPLNAEGYPSSKAVAFQCSAPEWVAIWRPDPCPTCLLPISNAGPMASSSFVISYPPGPAGIKWETAVRHFLCLEEDEISVGPGYGTDSSPPATLQKRASICRFRWWEPMCYQ